MMCQKHLVQLVWKHEQQHGVYMAGGVYSLLSTSLR